MSAPTNRGPHQGIDRAAAHHSMPSGGGGFSHGPELIDLRRPMRALAPHLLQLMQATASDPDLRDIMLNDGSLLRLSTVIARTLRVARASLDASVVLASAFRSLVNLSTEGNYARHAVHDCGGTQMMVSVLREGVAVDAEARARRGGDPMALPPSLSSGGAGASAVAPASKEDHIWALAVENIAFACEMLAQMCRLPSVRMALKFSSDVSAFELLPSLLQHPFGPIRTWARIALLYRSSHVVILHDCCNPFCSRQESHPGEFPKCGNCGTVFYCGRDCQRRHWRNEHRFECAIAADAAAAAPVRDGLGGPGTSYARSHAGAPEGRPTEGEDGTAASEAVAAPQTEQEFVDRFLSHADSAAGQRDTVPDTAEVTPAPAAPRRKHRRTHHHHHRRERSGRRREDAQPREAAAAQPHASPRRQQAQRGGRHVPLLDDGSATATATVSGGKSLQGAHERRPRAAGTGGAQGHTDGSRQQGGPSTEQQHQQDGRDEDAAAADWPDHAVRGRDMCRGDSGGDSGGGSGSGSGSGNQPHSTGSGTRDFSRGTSQGASSGQSRVRFAVGPGTGTGGEESGRADGHQGRKRWRRPMRPAGSAAGSSSDGPRSGAASEEATEGTGGTGEGTGTTSSTGEGRAVGSEGVAGSHVGTDTGTGTTSTTGNMRAGANGTSAPAGTGGSTDTGSGDGRPARAGVTGSGAGGCSKAHPPASHTTGSSRDSTDRGTGRAAEWSEPTVPTGAGSLLTSSSAGGRQPPSAATSQHPPAQSEEREQEEEQQQRQQQQQEGGLAPRAAAPSVAHARNAHRPRTERSGVSATLRAPSAPSDHVWVERGRERAREGPQEAPHQQASAIVAHASVPDPGTPVLDPRRAPGAEMRWIGDEGEARPGRPHEEVSPEAAWGTGTSSASCPMPSREDDPWTATRRGARDEEEEDDEDEDEDEGGRATQGTTRARAADQRGQSPPAKRRRGADGGGDGGVYEAPRAMAGHGRDGWSCDAAAMTAPRRLEEARDAGPVAATDGSTQALVGGAPGARDDHTGSQRPWTGAPAMEEEEEGEEDSAEAAQGSSNATDEGRGVQGGANAGGAEEEEDEEEGDEETSMDTARRISAAEAAERARQRKQRRAARAEAVRIVRAAQHTQRRHCDSESSSGPPTRSVGPPANMSSGEMISSTQLPAGTARRQESLGRVMGEAVATRSTSALAAAADAMQEEPANGGGAEGSAEGARFAGERGSSGVVTHEDVRRHAAANGEAPAAGGRGTGGDGGGVLEGNKGLAPARGAGEEEEEVDVDSAGEVSCAASDGDVDEEEEEGGGRNGQGDGGGSSKGDGRDEDDEDEDSLQSAGMLAAAATQGQGRSLTPPLVQSATRYGATFSPTGGV